MGCKGGMGGLDTGGAGGGAGGAGLDAGGGGAGGATEEGGGGGGAEEEPLGMAGPIFSFSSSGLRMRVMQRTIYNTNQIFQILSHTHTLSLHLCLSVCPSICMSVPLPLTHTHNHSHTHTHTHTRTHSLSLIHTHTHHKKCIDKNTVCQAIQCKVEGIASGRLTGSEKGMHHTGESFGKADGE